MPKMILIPRQHISLGLKTGLFHCCLGLLKKVCQTQPPNKEQERQNYNSWAIVQLCLHDITFICIADGLAPLQDFD